MHHPRSGRYDWARSDGFHPEVGAGTPFTVWTRRRAALRRSALLRVYCIVINSAGRDLNELLVESGLTRTYGVRTMLPDARDSRAYLENLKQLEKQAMRQRMVAWRIAPQ